MVILKLSNWRAFEFSQPLKEYIFLKIHSKFLNFRLGKIWYFLNLKNNFVNNKKNSNSLTSKCLSFKIV